MKLMILTGETTIYALHVDMTINHQQKKRNKRNTQHDRDYVSGNLYFCKNDEDIPIIPTHEEDSKS